MTKHLITSALPYINGVKHLGNLIGSMLPADVFARYLRAKNFDVLFICATDDHGTPAELAAAKANLPVNEFCDLQYKVQAKLCNEFFLSFDYFGRTSAKENHELTQHFAKKLEEQGYIEERTIKQLYSIDDARFLPDRYVIGTCPHCGYESAQGDQCENCTKVLEPLELIEPRSAISGSKNLEVRSSKHLFLLQSKLVPELHKWIDQQQEWPKGVKAIANKWLNEGVQDRGITRDLKWGVPVTKAGFEGKVFYVWFDAPIGYIAATEQWAHAAEPGQNRDWKSYWYNAINVHYTQFMAKDNVPFHTISFPATILGTKEPWKLPDYIKGFNWLTYYGGKFSTSKQRGIFMDKALELYPADYWRYYLIKNAPEKGDASFTWEHFAETVNKDLADNLGNFCQRFLKIIEKNFNFIVPAVKKLGDTELLLAKNLQVEFNTYTEEFDKLNFGKAARSLRELWKKGNEYINDSAPWKLLKSGAESDMENAALVLRTAVNLLRLYAIISEPIIPKTCAAIKKALNIENEKNEWPTSILPELQKIAGGGKISSPGILFNKILPEEIKKYEQIFGAAKVTPQELK